MDFSYKWKGEATPIENDNRQVLLPFRRIVKEVGKGGVITIE